MKRVRGLAVVDVKSVKREGLLRLRKMLTECAILGESFFVIPKYDLLPALVCVYFWIVSCTVAINIEV